MESHSNNYISVTVHLLKRLNRPCTVPLLTVSHSVFQTQHNTESMSCHFMFSEHHTGTLFVLTA